jgi:hypothetical protein
MARLATDTALIDDEIDDDDLISEKDAGRRTS